MGLKIVLWRKPSYQIYVQNLIPQGERESLEKAEHWNRVIEELCAEIFKPVAQRTNVKIELEEGDIQITSISALKPLKSWNRLAPPVTEQAIRATRSAGIPFSLRRMKKPPTRNCQRISCADGLKHRKSGATIKSKRCSTSSRMLFILGRYDRHRAGLGFWQ